MVKKLEQQVADHRQYEAAYDRADAWLREVQSQLSTCHDTTGDREDIQRQLETLHVRSRAIEIAKSL